MTKAVIFDCFGVLYVDASHYFYQTNLANYDQLLPELHELDKAYDYGFVSYAEHATAIAELTGLDADMVARKLHGKVELNQQLLDYSQTLRPNYRLGLLSNIGSGGMDKFFSSGERERLFDAVVLSGDVGVVKPSPAIYEIAAEHLGVLVEECIMIDDRQENCEGAEAAGMESIHYRDNAQLKRDLAGALALSDN